MPDALNHSFASLGTHLTLDLNGNVRFGPDLEWISAPSEGDEALLDERGSTWWTEHLLTPELSPSTRHEMHRAITAYLDKVEEDGLKADYSGLRPKLIGPDQKGFQDFVIDVRGGKEFRGGGSGGLLVSLLGGYHRSFWEDERGSWGIYRD